PYGAGAVGGAATGRFRGGQVGSVWRPRQPGRVSVHASIVLGESVVGIRHSGRTGRRNSAMTSPIRHTRVAIVVLPAESEPLLGHVIVRDRHIPGLEWIPGIPGKVGCADRRGRGSFTVDGREQHEIASGIVDHAAANG